MGSYLWKDRAQVAQLRHEPLPSIELYEAEAEGLAGCDKNDHHKRGLDMVGKIDPVWRRGEGGGGQRYSRRGLSEERVSNTLELGFVTRPPGNKQGIS